MFDNTTLELLLILCMGHFAGDFVLQNDRIAIEKCPGQDATLPWYWWMIAHSACHGLITTIFTGSALIGAAEWIAHFTIDYFKCKGKFSLLTDQILHLTCKFVWTLACFSEAYKNMNS